MQSRVTRCNVAKIKWLPKPSFRLENGKVTRRLDIIHVTLVDVAYLVIYYSPYLSLLGRDTQVNILNIEIVLLVILK